MLGRNIVVSSQERYQVYCAIHAICCFLPYLICFMTRRVFGRVSNVGSEASPGSGKVNDLVGLGSWDEAWGLQPQTGRRG